MAKVGAKEQTIDWVAIRYVMNDAVKMAFTAESGLAFQDASDEVADDPEDDDEIVDDAEDEYFADVFRVDSIRLITVGSFLFAKITKLDGGIEYIPYHKIEVGYSQLAADE